jgi:membrane protein DedA with SNARE-associated domain
MNLFETLTTQLAGPLGYVGVLVLLIACGMGLPVPEDIILISGGYIAHAADHKPYFMMCIGLLGILLGDSVIYWLGRHFGQPFAERSFLKRYLTTERLGWVKAQFKSHGEKLIMGARFLPGIRAVTFFTAGTSHVPFYHFLFFDGLAALVSAPLWVFLGFRFGERVVQWAKEFEHGMGLIVLLLLVWLVFRVVSARRRAAVEARSAVSSEPVEGVLPKATVTDPTGGS